MSDNKIIPLGGSHRSAASLLAEIMNDENLEKCVIVVIGKDGETFFAHYEMTLAELCFAAAVIQRGAFSDI